MIEYIKGTITALEPTAVVVETPGGVAYRLEISLPVYSGLSGQTTARLLVHEVIREDAWTLYGFLEPRERELFRALTGVSGVGAATARLILSAIETPALEQAIAGGDLAKLKAVKGIGAKTAQRIIVDLKDKIQPSEGAPAAVSHADDMEQSETFQETLAALVMLGFAKPLSLKVLRGVFKKEPLLTVETAIRRALALLH